MPKPKITENRFIEFNGTPEDIATQVHERFVFPLFEKMAKQNPGQEKLFALHMFGLSGSLFSDCVTTKEFEKFMDDTRDTVALQLKKERGELKN